MPANVIKITELFNERLEPARVLQSSDKNIALWQRYFAQRGINPAAEAVTDEAVVESMVECVQKHVNEFEWENPPGPRHFLRKQERNPARQFNPKTDRTEFDRVPEEKKEALPTFEEVLNDKRIEAIKREIQHRIDGYQCYAGNRVNRYETERRRALLYGIMPNPPHDKKFEGWLKALRLVQEGIAAFPEGRG